MMTGVSDREDIGWRIDPGSASTRRRWWRIGWKIALVFLILMGLVRPWITYSYWKARIRKRIERLNGLAMCQNRLGISSLGGLEVEFGPLDNVYFLGPQVDDSSLRILEDLTALRVLTLTNTRVTDEGLSQLSRFHQLNSLYIGNIDHTKLIGATGEALNTTPLITGRGLEALQDLPNLQVIQLIGPQTTDQDLQALKHLRSLVLVDLVGTGVTEAAVAELKTVLPKCQVRRR